MRNHTLLFEVYPYLRARDERGDTRAFHLPPRQRSFARLAVIAVAVALAFFVTPALAQQYVVDDAEIVDYRACHVEAWHGERASWILPACQPVRNLEVAAGVGFIDDGFGARETEYAIEAKTLFRPLSTNDWGAGLVVGVGPNPSASAGEVRFGDVYAFVPISVSLLSDRLVLHPNVGWLWQRDDHADHGHSHGGDDAHHALTWGFRGDAAAGGPFTLIGEIYGEDRRTPEYQIGVRTAFPAAGVEMDVSWGGHLETGTRGPGFTVGLAFTARPFM